MRYNEKTVKWKRGKTLHSETINRLARGVNTEWMDRNYIIFNTNGYDPENAIRIDENINTDLVKKLNDSIDTKDIVNIIKSNLHTIEHIAVFGKAIQKCSWLKDWNAAHEIMKLAIDSGLDLNEIIFNIFLNTMAKSDSPELCVEYFHLMITKYHLQPDPITFSCVLKSFKTQRKCEEAEKVWHLMLNKYNIKPDKFVLVEMLMIYARTEQIDKARILFDEYIQRVQNGELQVDAYVFHAYLNGFSRIGDIKGIQDVTKLMKQYNIELDEYMVSDIMRGFLIAEKYDKCLKTLQSYIDNGNIPNVHMMAMKCMALSNIILDMKRNRKSFKEKYEIFDQIKSIPNEFKQYGLKMQQFIVSIQLSSAIYLYHDNHPMEIVHLFRRFVEKKLIGYKQYDENDNNYLLSFRMLHPVHAQFILRYLFAFRIGEILNSVGDEKDKIKIIVGKGKGSKHGAQKMGPFIMKELLSWKPPIQSYVDEKNEGQIIIDKQQIMPYCEVKMNYARKRLMHGSKDWHIPERD